MNGVARVYGQALYDLARDEALDERIYGQLVELKRIFQENRDYLRLVSTPAISKTERLQILQDGFAQQVEPYVLNFMKLLTEKGYMSAFCACCDVYRECYNSEHNILPVKVTTATPLTDAQAERLRSKLSGITGKQVELDMRLDPACLGGMRLDYDGRQVEDTVRGRIDRVHHMLKNTTL